MAIKIENRFVVPAPIDQAWAILTDVPRIAPCLPGAELTEVVDASTYRGQARVKVGPMQLVFKGEARLARVDAATHTSTMSIRGADTKGRGNVQSEMTFALAQEGDATRVDVTTELTLSGSVAQYGRGVGLIKELCNQYTAQFAQNLATRIQGGESSTAPGEAKPISAISLVSGAVRSMVTRKSDSPGAPDEGDPRNRNGR